MYTLTCPSGPLWAHIHFGADTDTGDMSGCTNALSPNGSRPTASESRVQIPPVRLTHPMTSAEVLQSLQACKMDLRALSSYIERMKDTKQARPLTQWFSNLAVH